MGATMIIVVLYCIYSTGSLGHPAMLTSPGSILFTVRGDGYLRLSNRQDEDAGQYSLVAALDPLAQ